MNLLAAAQCIPHRETLRLWGRVGITSWITHVKNIILRIALLFGGLTTFAPHGQAQGGVPLWTNYYGAPGFSVAVAIAVDRSGNVFVTGYSGSDYATVAYSGAGVPLWTNLFPSGAAKGVAVDRTGNVFVTGYSGSDYATVAYSGAGVPLWTNRCSSGEANALAVDSTGNVFVTGTSTGTNGLGDYLTVAYSGAGVPLWTNRFGPDNNQNVASDITTSSSGNVIVTGFSSGDYLTVAYSAAGVLLWTNRYDGPDKTYDVAKAITADRNGNVIVTGTSSPVSGYNSDYATVAYSGAGVPLWTNRYDGPANWWDEARALVVDSSGNVVVTGKSYADSSTYDYATVAYSSGGVPLWTNRYNGPANDVDEPFAIAADANGNVVVTGDSAGYVGSYPNTLDYATVAYSSTGLPLWTNRYNGSGGTADRPRAVAVDGNGNVVVTGRSVIRTGSGNVEGYATIKYSSSVASVSGPRLGFQSANEQLVLSWTNSTFLLQATPVISGTFSNIPDAASPYTNRMTGSQQYFRLKSN